MKPVFFAFSLIVLLISACKKEDSTDVGFADLSIHLSFEVDGAPLAFDTLRYINDAGEQYSVTRLEYFLSNFRFYKNGLPLFSKDTTIYVNARNTGSFLLRQLPAGSFDSIACYIGIDSANNVHGNLPQTTEIVGMEWPDMMGGGYHFLKLEGHWQDTAGTPGYAMHLGTNMMLVHAGSSVGYTVRSGATNSINLVMNLNEWYRNPANYSFDQDGVYTMGDMMLMTKIAHNGADVLQFKAP